MVNNIRTYPVLRILAGAACVLALFILLRPHPEYPGLSLAPPAFQQEPAPAGRVLTPERLNAFFDIARLPLPKAPEPAPVLAPVVDPAAAIKRHKLLGITISEDDAVALVSDGGRQILLKEGDSLAGFVATQIRPRGIVFEKDGVVAVLSLP